MIKIPNCIVKESAVAVNGSGSVDGADLGLQACRVLLMSGQISEVGSGLLRATNLSCF